MIGLFALRGRSDLSLCHCIIQYVVGIRDSQKQPAAGKRDSELNEMYRFQKCLVIQLMAGFR